MVSLECKRNQSYSNR